MALPTIINLKSKGNKVIFKNNKIIVNNIPLELYEATIKPPINKKRQKSDDNKEISFQQPKKIVNLDKFKFKPKIKDKTHEHNVEL